MMIPFMSCSARLPVYVLLISALFDPEARVGPFSQASLILLLMYALSTVSALAVGAIYKRTILKSPTPPLVLELPPYRLPRVRNTLLHVYDRTADFVRDAGTVILAMTVVLWALLSFPKPPEAAVQQVDPIEVRRSAPDEGQVPPIEYSVGGSVGKAMEPALTPMGQDFRMGIAILGSFAAREVFVSTLGLVYGIEAEDEDKRAAARGAARGEAAGRVAALHAAVGDRADGVLRVRVPVHVDAGGGAPRDAVVALAAADVREHDGAGVRHGGAGVPGRAAARTRRARSRAATW
jgi:Fe2+ transport system protein B